MARAIVSAERRRLSRAIHSGGAPAERAGIETGDQIIEVDGKSTEGWKNDQAVKALRGEAGSKITITIRRAGITEPIKYRLTRARIHMRSVPPGDACSMAGWATSP